MSLAACPRLRRLLARLFLVAAMAFVLQGMLIGGADLAAAHEHVHADGRTHSHDITFGHAGHIHIHINADQPLDDGDNGVPIGKVLCFGMSAGVAVVPVPDAALLPSGVGHPVDLTLNDTHPGIEPGGLQRPPRPTSIA